jgi:F0F1-type ATP synthase assembly protein I
MLRPLRSNRVAPEGVPNLIRLDTVDWRWVLNLALKLISVAILPVVLGIGLDHYFQTSPIITLPMLLLGLNVGIFTIARTIAEIYARVENNSQRVGGDQ